MSEMRCPVCGWRLALELEEGRWWARCPNERLTGVSGRGELVVLKDGCPVGRLDSSLPWAVLDLLTAHPEGMVTAQIAEAMFGGRAANANNAAARLVRARLVARKQVPGERGWRYLYRSRARTVTGWGATRCAA